MARPRKHQPKFTADEAEAFFDRVRASRDRAERLRETAELIRQHLGDPCGMRYDGIGSGPTGPKTDPFVQSIARCEAAEARALAAAQAAEELIAEAYEICVRVLERPDMRDTIAIQCVIDYYVEHRSLKSISTELGIGVAGVSRAKARGLLYLEYAHFKRAA